MSYTTSTLEQEFEDAVKLYQTILQNESLFSARARLAALKLRDIVTNLINY